MINPRILKGRQTEGAKGMLNLKLVLADFKSPVTVEGNVLVFHVNQAILNEPSNDFSKVPYLKDVLDHVIGNPQIQGIYFNMRQVTLIERKGLEKFGKVLLYVQNNGRHDIALKLLNATQLMQTSMHQFHINPHYEVVVNR